MSGRNTKNITIILLCLLSMYLTSQLWFEDISNRNFFYFFNEILSQPTERDKSGIVKPYRIITYNGNKTFSVMYNGINSSVQKAGVDAIITDLLRDGEFISSQTIDWPKMDWDSIFSSRCYIYQYKISMPADIFARGFGQKGNALIARVKNFDSIIIKPGRLAGDKTIILFIDQRNDLMYEYSLNGSSNNRNIVANMQKSDTSGIRYISSAQRVISIMEKNVFIPWIDSGYGYSSVSVTNPYIISERVFNVIEKNVSVFFENPSTIRSDPISDVYTFSDDSIVVKYYPNDVLEYYDYRSSDKKSEPLLTRDYNIAVGFISNDKSIVNEYYLSDYQVDNEKTVFYFDYVINDMPVLFTPTYKSDKGMASPIEVTVENEKVSKYKKLVYNLHVNENEQINLSVDFIGSLNSMFTSEDDLNESRVTSVELGYKMDSGKELVLYWFLDVDGSAYIQSAQQR